MQVDDQTGRFQGFVLPEPGSSSSEITASPLAATREAGLMPKPLFDGSPLLPQCAQLFADLGDSLAGMRGRFLRTRKCSGALAGGPTAHGSKTEFLVVVRGQVVRTFAGLAILGYHAAMSDEIVNARIAGVRDFERTTNMEAAVLDFDFNGSLHCFLASFRIRSRDTQMGNEKYGQSPRLGQSAGSLKTKASGRAFVDVDIVTR